jgi:hypothetical protein
MSDVINLGAMMLDAHQQSQNAEFNSIQVCFLRKVWTPEKSPPSDACVALIYHQVRQAIIFSCYIL